MISRSKLALASAMMAMVLTACAGPNARQDAPGSQAPLSTAPKRITAAILTDLYALGPRGGAVPGKGNVEGLLHAGLANDDEHGVLRPRLAEAAPSVENGLWRVLPDGRMETTWRIRAGARWHDGAPFTAGDLQFTAQVKQDQEAGFRSLAFGYIESLEAPDERTILVKWRRTYIDADKQFGSPMPRHLLEPVFADNRLALQDLPYWSEGFVGLGPFKVREWVRGSHILLEANDDYVLGRPKVDSIEVKLIPDPNTLIANILAGSVQLMLGRGISLEQALQVRDQWRDGRVEISLTNWILIYPQHLYTDPPVVRDVRFRRALLHAVDRQEMVDTLQFGFSEVAHSVMSPGQPQYQEFEARIPRYGYEPRRAAQLLEGLGYNRGADGTFRDARGLALGFEFRTVPTDINTKSLLATTDYWKQFGIEVTPVVIPAAQQRMLDYRAQFPAFELLRNPNDLRQLENHHSSKQRTAANNWTGSYAGYSNPEYDVLFERYSATIPMQERVQLVGQLIHYLADQVVVMGLFYDTLPVLMGNHIANLPATRAEGTEQVFGAHLWDVK